MAEKDVIYSKINIIKNCLMAIEKAKQAVPQAEFRQSIYEINLQRAIQACVDMANVVIAKEGLGLPNTYKQSFEILCSKGLIAQYMSDVLSKMVGFRNLSVHEYGLVNPAIVDAIVKNHLPDFERYYEVIYKHVEKEWK